MKTVYIILLLLCSALALPVANGQITKENLRNELGLNNRKLKKADKTKIGELSKQNFIAEFGGTTGVSWIKSEEYDEAIFTCDGHEMNAYYDAMGRLAGLIAQKEFGDLPPVGQTNLKVLLDHYSVQQIIYYTHPAGYPNSLKLWGSELTGTDTYYVEMKYGFRKLIVCVDNQGRLTLFKQL